MYSSTVLQIINCGQLKVLGVCIVAVSVNQVKSNYQYSGIECIHQNSLQDKYKEAQTNGTDKGNKCHAQLGQVEMNCDHFRAADAGRDGSVSNPKQLSAHHDGHVAGESWVGPRWQGAVARGVEWTYLS